MTPERYARVVDLFHAAATEDSSVRASFLSLACEDDAELRSAVERMLAADQQSPQFLENLPDDIAAGTALNLEQSLVGQTLDQYRIIARLGSGGMGCVFLSHDLRLNRRTALKLLSRTFASDPIRLGRFEREVLSVSAVNHPNIVTVYGVGHIGGFHFLATEYVEGQTLREVLSRGPLSIRDTIGIGKQIAGALEAAHAHGIIHRDIKPENIMQRPDGLVKLVDFGVAKWTRTMNRMDELKSLGIIETTPGLIVGTPRYMSPEQARGLEIDCRTDVFSLGAVLYEMLAGQPAIPGETPSDMIAAILMRNPEPLQRLRPDCPGSLIRIVHKALEKDLEKRYQSIKEIAADFKTAGDHFAAPRWNLHGKRLAAAIACASALLLGALLLVPFRGARPSVDSIAVLPLRNEGGPDLQFVADGLTDSLMGDLVEISQLRVVSRSSASRIRTQILARTHASYIPTARALLRGGVSGRGDRLIVHVEVIDTANERELWRGSYDSGWADLLQVQATISKEVIQALGIDPGKQTRQEWGKRHDVRPEAYRLYLKARSSLLGSRQSDLEEALLYAHRALEVDSTYGLAAVVIANAYVSLADYISPRTVMPKAREYALRAIEAGGATSDAHVALGLVKLLYDWDWDAAEEEFKWDSVSNPRGLETFSCYLHYKGALGHPTEATATVRRLLALDPLSTWANQEMGCNLYYARQYEKAVEQSSTTLKMNPDFPIGYLVAGRAFVQQHKFPEALAALEQGRTLDPSWPFLLEELAYADAASGQPAMARKLLSQLDAIAQRRYVDPVLIALVYLQLGDRDKAFSYLENGYIVRSSSMPWLKAEPRFDPVRSDIRYLQMLRRVGLPN